MKHLSNKMIMAAADFSRHTDAVSQRALSLAQKYDTALVVLHVVDYLWPLDAEYAEYVSLPIGETEEKLVKAACKRLDSLLETTDMSAAKRVVIVGRPKDEILLIAD